MRRCVAAALPAAVLGACLSLPLAATVPAAAAAPLSGSSVLSLASFGGRLYAGTDSGLEVQSGSRWSAVGGPIAGREVNALVASGGWLLAATDSGVLRSQDGLAWSAAGLNGERVASLSAGGGTLLAGSGTESSKTGIVQRSDNLGGSWSPAAGTAPLLLGLSGDVVQAVLAPQGSLGAWAGTGGDGAFHSTDGRGSWSAASSGMASSWVTSFWLDPGTGRLLAGSDDGLYAWSGSAWSAVAFPQQDPWVQVLATGPGGRPLAGTYDGGVFDRDTAGHWSSMASGLPSVLSLLALSGGGVLVGTSDGLSCIACPSGVPVPAAGQSSGAKPAASLPPPAARAGATAAAGRSTASASASGAAASSPDAGLGAGAAVAGTGSSGGSGVPARWWIAGGLVALSALLFAAGRVRARAPR